MNSPTEQSQQQQPPEQPQPESRLELLTKTFFTKGPSSMTNEELEEWIRLKREESLNIGRRQAAARRSSTAGTPRGPRTPRSGGEAISLDDIMGDTTAPTAAAPAQKKGEAISLEELK